MSWNDSNDMMKAFNTAAKASAMDAGAMSHTSETKLDDLIFSWLDYSRKSLDDFANMGDALSSFKWWLENARHMPKAVNDETTLSVKITMHVGKMSVEFGADRTFLISSSQQRQAGYEALSRAIMKDLSDWVAKHAGGMGAVSSGNGGAGAIDGEQIITVQTLAHEFADGKHRFKVRGGNFTKWGVAIYPEVLEAAGLSVDDIPMGEVPFEGSARLLMNGKTPKKVLELSGSMLQ